MATPNIEELIDRLYDWHNTSAEQNRLDMQKAADLLQSLAERIKELDVIVASYGELDVEQAKHIACMESDLDTLRAQLADAELHTKQIERGLDKATAQLAEIEATEPVAYLYEMATTMMTPGNYGRWVLKLEYQKPCVPEGAVRNLQELFTRHMPAQDVNAELVEALEMALKLNSFREFNDHIPAMRTALSKYKGAK